MKRKNKMTAQFEHFDHVNIDFGKAGKIKGTIHSITFTAAKVYYDILVTSDEGYTEILNKINSIFVNKQK